MTSKQNKIRIAFEAWAEFEGYDLEDFLLTGCYKSVRTQHAFFGYSGHAAETEALIEELAEALRALWVAVTYGGLDDLPNDAGKGYLARVPEGFTAGAKQALQRVEAYRGKE